MYIYLRNVNGKLVPWTDDVYGTGRQVDYLHFTIGRLQTDVFH